VYTYPNGDVYSGLFKAGKKEGSGSYFFKVRRCNLDPALKRLVSALERTASSSMGNGLLRCVVDPDSCGVSCCRMVSSSSVV